MRKIFLIILTVFLLFACKSQPFAEISVEIKEPAFQIVSIVIIQADLVNTQFEAILKVDNPNDFALELTSLKYELHGNGLFWADGTENNVFSVPAESSLETKFKFTMNFIDMNRKLLDDVIAMRQVRYNFKGKAQVQADLPHPSSDTIDFDISGLSDVKPKAD